MARHRRFVPSIDRLDLRITPSDIVPTIALPPANGSPSVEFVGTAGEDALLIDTVTWVLPTGVISPEQLSSEDILAHVDWSMPMSTVVEN